MSKRSVPVSFVIGICLCLSQPGCGLDWAYIIPTVSGQLELLRDADPIDDALAGGELTDEQARLLRLVRDVRVFARDEIGLNVGNHYTTFYNAHGEPIAFNISASRREKFEPYFWSFPFVGSLPFLGYFDVDAVRAERDRLIDLGYDVFIYEVDAYFVGDYFPNPILSPMLERPEENLIDTVIHELLHATIVRNNDTPFNESLATFVGRTGALQFIDTYFTAEPARRSAAIERFEDSDRYSAFALELYTDLDAYYALEMPTAIKIAGREAIFQAGRDHFESNVLPQMHHPESYTWVADYPSNNAILLGVRRYNLELELFDRIFNALDGRWSEALAVFEAAANAPDAYAYLRAWEPALTAKTGIFSPESGNRARTARHTPPPCPRSRPTTWVPDASSGR